MERSEIELLHGWTQPNPSSPTPEAQPYNEMERSGIELLHGWTSSLYRYSFAAVYFRMTASATFIPSIAADVIPPA